MTPRRLATPLLRSLPTRPKTAKRDDQRIAASRLARTAVAEEEVRPSAAVQAPTSTFALPFSPDWQQVNLFGEEAEWNLSGEICVYQPAGTCHFRSWDEYERYLKRKTDLRLVPVLIGWLLASFGLLLLIWY